MKLPEKSELLELFEVEPVLDPGVPWAYNTLTFTTTRGDDVVRCVLVPAYGEMDFDWAQAGRPQLHLRVGAIEASAWS